MEEMKPLLTWLADMEAVRGANPGLKKGGAGGKADERR